MLSFVGVCMLIVMIFILLCMLLGHLAALVAWYPGPQKGQADVGVGFRFISFQTLQPLKHAATYFPHPLLPPDRALIVL